MIEILGYLKSFVQQLGKIKFTNEVSFVGLVGAVTGILSLSWQIFKSLKEFPFLRIFHPLDNLAMYFEVQQPYDDYNGTRFVIYLRISNLSSAPITIESFHLILPFRGHLVSDMNIKLSDKYTVINDDGYTHEINFTNVKQLRPLIRMDPYGADEGIVFFHKGPKIKKSSIIGLLCIKSTRGMFYEILSLQKSR